jgi:glutathione synthase/RimK-type ligase-like ATP-grasp enzyme
MILVCGGLADSVTELVCARLQDCGYAYRLVDMGTYPSGYRVNWRWQGERPTGYISGPDWRVDLDDISGVYARYLGADGRLPLPDVAPELAASVYAESDTALMTVFEHLPCAVVNRINGGLSNHSKPYQAMLIRECGLRIPPTLVTSDPRAARRFYDEHNGDVIYKSLSGIRSIVRRVGTEQLARFDFLPDGAAQFQAYIPGENVRVHTVDEQVFATRVLSESVDYRYARREGNTVEMIATELPPAVTAACLRLARALDLLIAGIDLKVTPDGQHYCFEINPSPGFSYYEQGSGQPISAALADLLHHGETATVAPGNGFHNLGAAAQPVA